MKRTSASLRAVKKRVATMRALSEGFGSLAELLTQGKPHGRALYDLERAIIAGSNDGLAPLRDLLLGSQPALLAHLGLSWGLIAANEAQANGLDDVPVQSFEEWASCELQRLSVPPIFLVWVPDFVRAAMAWQGGPGGEKAKEQAFRFLHDARKGGWLSLRPEGGMGRLSDADRALCPKDADGVPLSHVLLRSSAEEMERQAAATRKR